MLQCRQCSCHVCSITFNRKRSWMGMPHPLQVGWLIVPAAGEKRVRERPWSEVLTARGETIEACLLQWPYLLNRTNCWSNKHYACTRGERQTAGCIPSRWRRELRNKRRRGPRDRRNPSLCNRQDSRQSCNTLSICWHLRLPAENASVPAMSLVGVADG